MSMTELEQTLISLSQKEKDFNKKYEADLVEARRKLNKDLLSIEMSALAVKNDFVTFIKDKSIPVDTRWNLFKQAPKAVKNGSYDFSNNESDGVDYIIHMINTQDYQEEYLHFDTVSLIGMFFDVEEIQENNDDELLALYHDAIEAFLQTNSSSLFLIR